MSKRFLMFIILSLLAINVYTIINFYRLKKQDVTVLNKNFSESDKIHAYKLNFEVGIQNSNIRLEEIIARDSLGAVFPLKDIISNGQGQILVCRFSELHCESCVNSAIRQFRQWTDSIGKNNMLFLGAYRNNKIFNRTKPLYAIHNLNVYNVSGLNIPVEELGYPYYFVLNNDLTISNVFVPDKATPTITNDYLKMIDKRYFNRNKVQENF
jgi:hypothetical protein